MVNSVSVREERREKTREDEREEMKKCFFFLKMSQNQKKKRQTNLSHNDSKKETVGRIIRSKVQNITRVFNYVRDSNSIFRPAGINLERVSARTVTP